MKQLFLLAEVVIFSSLFSCQPKTEPENTYWEKVDFSLDQLDEEGLVGPIDGKRALTYEFCIPPEKASEISRIDGTAQFLRTRGRIGCTPDQVLCLGHTHQPEFRQVLRRLASLDYVVEIREVHFE